MKDFSYITSSSPAFIENMYLEFIRDPNSIDPEMKKFFEGFDFAIANGSVASNGTATKAVTIEPAEGLTSINGWRKELGAYRMILGYRNKGHLIAKTNPIRARKDRGANLDPAFFGFTAEDMDEKVEAAKLL